MKLETFLECRGINFLKRTHHSAYTSQGLAQAEHVSGYLVAKPVIVKSASGFAMCVLPAPMHLNMRQVADVLNDDDVRLASEAEMADLFPDCELGAEPPVGALFGMKTIIDERLHADEYIVMQAGRHTEAIQMRRKDWESLCNPVVAKIAGNG